MNLSLSDLTPLCQTRIETIYKLYLQETTCSTQQLQQAMNYAVLNGGKRIRPLFVYATGYALDAPWENLDAPAAAIELIHSYSLIHDDLPAMDNADLRRGKPACHKIFGEAIAILAGDALQPLAFEIIASHPSSLTAQQRITMINTLCRASGLNGMAAGQVLDMLGIKSFTALTEMYSLKTSKLLIASVHLGLIAANKQNEHLQNSLEQFAEYLGLAFQIQDDLLDIESPAEITGKPQGLDIANNKITYPSFLGVEKTRDKIQELFARALQSIEHLDNKASLLRELATFLMQRKK